MCLTLKLLFWERDREKERKREKREERGGVRGKGRRRGWKGRGIETTADPFGSLELKEGKAGPGIPAGQIQQITI